MTILAIVAAIVLIIWLDHPKEEVSIDDTRYAIK